MQFVDKLEFDQKELRDENFVLRSRLQVPPRAGAAGAAPRPASASGGARTRSAQRGALRAFTQDLLRLGLGSEYPVSTRECPV